jgi:hypothetical protein
MRLLRATAAAALLAIGTLAAAQTPTREQMFAEYVKQMVGANISSANNEWKANVLGTKPQFKNTADNPVTGRSFSDAFAQMQADSSNSEFMRGAPVLTAQPADPVVKESFASTFSRMQAASSNSDEWKLPATEGGPAYATASNMTLASESGKPTIAERIARAMRAVRTGSSQSN